MEISEILIFYIADAHIPYKEKKLHKILNFRPLLKLKFATSLDVFDFDKNRLLHSPLRIE
jgi:hypothetical protein